MTQQSSTIRTHCTPSVAGCRKHPSSSQIGYCDCSPKNHLPRCRYQGIQTSIRHVEESSTDSLEVDRIPSLKYFKGRKIRTFILASSLRLLLVRLLLLDPDNIACDCHIKGYTCQDIPLRSNVGCLSLSPVQQHVPHGVEHPS